ncbi:MAG: hypothetical protein QXW09_04895 [Thermoproteota archaeon]
MQYFEGTLAIILSSFLLLLTITVSQGIRSKTELLDDVERDLIVEVNVLRICQQNSHDVNKMLKEIVDFLDSNGVRWCTVELFNRKNGGILVENKSFSNIVAEQVRYIKVVKISSEDTTYVTVGVEK